MARNHWLIEVAANFEPQKRQELDARESVDTFTDLTNSITWQDSNGNERTYLNMRVFVKDEKVRYILNDTDYTVAWNWEVISWIWSVDWSWVAYFTVTSPFVVDEVIDLTNWNWNISWTCTLWWANIDWIGKIIWTDAADFFDTAWMKVHIDWVSEVYKSKDVVYDSMTSLHFSIPLKVWQVFWVELDTGGWEGLWTRDASINTLLTKTDNDNVEIHWAVSIGTDDRTGMFNILGKWNIKNLVPEMTDNTHPSWVAYSSADSWDAYLLFDRDSWTRIIDFSASVPVELSYEFTSPQIIIRYKVGAPSMWPNRMPKDWEMQWWDWTSRTTLDTQTWQTFSALEERYYDISNSTAYIKYRLYISVLWNWSQIFMATLEFYWLEVWPNQDLVISNDCSLGMWTKNPLTRIHLEGASSEACSMTLNELNTGVYSPQGILFQYTWTTKWSVTHNRDSWSTADWVIEILWYRGKWISVDAFHWDVWCWNKNPKCTLDLTPDTFNWDHSFMYWVRLTTSQRLSLTTWAMEDWATVYDLDTHSYWVYSNGTWKEMDYI